MLITRIGVEDRDFTVRSLIDRCPKTTMLRELVMNAIEAAASAPPGQRRVEIGSVVLEGDARKLRIWNTGRGMTADELLLMGDLASSIRKRKALDGNFGIGAKVATLASNTHGVRYRSCHAGRVSEMVLGKRDGAYGRVLYDTPDGPQAVIDVTEQAWAEGCDPAQDWTEVVLLGNRPSQDTVAAPYDNDPPVRQDWVVEALHQRLFRVGGDVAVTLAPELRRPDGTCRLVTVAERADEDGQAEAVDTPEGIRIHYLFDPPPRSSLSAVGVVFQDEIYALVQGAAWGHMAPAFGIPLLARNISVYIELLPGYPALPDAYRQFLRHRGGEQQVVTTEHFADMVRRHRPAWLMARLADPDGGLGAVDAAAECADLLRALDLGSAAEAGRLPVPEIILLRDEQELSGRWMLGRAASYATETNQLFVNTLFVPALVLQERLRTEFAGTVPADAIEAWSRTVAERLLTRRALRSLLCGLAKTARREHWSEEHVLQATSSEALSLACANLVEQLPAVREVLGLGAAGNIQE